MARCPAMN